MGERAGSVVRVAAFDCGTNSLRVLVADVDPVTGRADELERHMRIVRLGEGVDRTGRLSEAALGRTFGALDELLELARAHDVDRMRLCATSAARDAENSEAFVAGVRARMGSDPVVLAGEDEARTSYLGATRALGADVPGPHLVVDIGGGSTELVLGEGAEVIAAESLNIGSVRLTERRLAGDPPTADEVDALRRDVADALAAGAVDPARARTVIGVAGTVTTVAAGVLGLPAYDRDRIHHAVLGVDAVRATVADLVAMRVEQRRALGYMHPGRADVIAAGGLVLTGILERTGVESLLVSEHDILDGIAWTLAREPDPRPTDRPTGS